MTEAAIDEAYDYSHTIVGNLVESWNESANELKNLWDALDDHEDITAGDVVEGMRESNNVPTNWSDLDELELVTEEVEAWNGHTYETEAIEIEGANATARWDLQEIYSEGTNSEGNAQHAEIRVTTDSGDIEYMYPEDWKDVWDEIEEIIEEVEDGLTMWVSGVYDEVQAGELDTEDLLTPREQAEMTSDDDDFNQAIADLQALNVATNHNIELELYLPGVDGRIFGELGVTSDTTIESGDTIDPGAEDEDYYFTYDVSQGEGEWDAYDDSTGIDGGTMYFEDEPLPETIYQIETSAGETVEVMEDDFQPLDDDGEEIDDWDEPEEWALDLSDDLDDLIADVEQIDFYAEESETNYETIQLQEEFEVASITDSDGNDQDEFSVESGEPHDDENYISEDEWKESQQNMEDLIEDYEDAQSDPIIDPGDWGIDADPNTFIGLVVVGFVFLIGVLGALNPLN